MPSLRPAHIEVRDILVVAEQERVAGIRIPHRVPASARKYKSRGALRQHIVAVRAGNLQSVESVVPQIEVPVKSRAQPMPRESGVGIDDPLSGSVLKRSPPTVLHSVTRLHI